MGLVGPLACMAWLLRCGMVGGEAWEASRALVGQSLDYRDFVLGVRSAPTPMERLVHLGLELPEVLKLCLIAGAGLLPWPALWALRRSRPPWVLGLALYALVMPLGALILAPGVAESGTVFRSGSALFIGGCALAGVGLERVCAWRGYPRWLPVCAFAAASLSLGAFNAHLVPSVSWVCPDGESTVFATRPLLCQRPALLLPEGMPPGRVAELAERFGVEEAWLTPSDGLGWGSDEPRLVLIDSLSGSSTSP